MITKDMLLIDVFRMEGVNVDARADVLDEFEMQCLGCPLSHGESVAEAAMVHGIDPDVMCNALNEAAKA